MKMLELLAPAKNGDSAIAAIEYGADAIYIGAASFGARQSASNSIEEIARTVDYAHRFGVRVYATLNTLIYEDELKAAERAANELVETGVDALIVQDMCFARMNLPIELHASTQTSNTSTEYVKFLQDVGFKRVVLERGLTLEQMAEIVQAAPNIEIEAFIHGAICVGISGKCYLSRALSPRSGNRGECMQACRLSYDLLSGSGKEIIKGKHLLSVKDMNMSQHIDSLIDMGVTSFKIEGRLKEIGYTKNIVAHYRNLLDEAILRRKNEGFIRSSQGCSHFDFEPNPEKSFSRAGCSYLAEGQESNLASFETPKATGEYLGKVISKTKNGVTLDNNINVTTGDGVCYIVDGELLGTNINQLQGDEISLNRYSKIGVGTHLFRNFDKQFTQILERSRTKRKIEVEAELTISKNELTLTYRDSYNNSSTTSIEGVFEPAKNSEKMRQTIDSQLKKCGDSEFECQTLTIKGEPLFIPSSTLAELRRETLQKLSCERTKNHPQTTPFTENRAAKHPENHLSGEGNVTNSVARQFYSDHGVEKIAKGWDIAPNMDGARLMQSRYCIRHEIGECLKRGFKLRDELILVRGNRRFRLEFDCRTCQMNIYNM